MAIRQWDGGGTNALWNNALNWDGNTLPGDGDGIVIGAGFGTTTFNGISTLTSLTIASLESQSGFEISGGILNIEGTATLASFSQRGGTLGGNGPVTVAGTVTWTTGTIRGTGTVNFNGPVTFAAQGNSKVIGTTGETRIVNLNQGAIWNDNTGSDLFLGGGSVLNNPAGQTFDIRVDGNGNAGIAVNSGNGTFNNAGTLIKSGGTGAFTINVPFNNTGTVIVNSGNLTLSGGGNLGNGVTGTGTLRFNGGDFQLNANRDLPLDTTVSSGSLQLNGISNIPNLTQTSGTISGTGTLNINNFNLTNGILERNGTINLNTFNHGAGTLQGNHDLTVSGPTSWTTGTLRGTGTTNFNGLLTLPQGNSKVIGTTGETRIVNLNQGAIWNDNTGSDLFLGGGSVLNNPAGQTFDIRVDGNGFAAIAVNSGNGTFNNAGTLIKSGGTGAFTINVPFNNTGTVIVNSGNLTLSGGGNLGNGVTGTGALRFNGGDFQLNANRDLPLDTTVSSGSLQLNGISNIPNLTQTSGTISGTGTLNINNFNLTNGILERNGTINLNTFNHGAGTLQGNHDLTVSGPTSWTTGTLRGTGTTNFNGLLTLPQGNSKVIGTTGETRIVNLNQGVIWNDNTGSDLFLGGGSVLNNPAGRTFDIKVDGNGFAAIAVNSGSGTVNNAGSFLKSGGTSNFTVNVDFNNTGLVESQSGILSFTGNYTQTSGNTRLNGGNFNVGSSRFLNLQAGNLSGNGTITGRVDSTAATLTPGLTPGSIGSLNIAGNYNETNASVIDIDIASLTQFDTLNINGTANFDGTVNIKLANGYTPNVGDSFPIFTYNSAPNLASKLNFTGLGISPGIKFTPVVSANTLNLVAVEEAVLSIDNVSISEGTSGTKNLTFTVSLNGITDPFSVAYQTADGTATVADNDYTAQNGVLNFNGTDGETKTISISVNGDNKVELAETFSVLLSNLQGNGILPILAPATATGTITNDDSASLTINDISQLEGNSGLTPYTFIVTLNNPVDTGISVNYATGNGTATLGDNDYQFTSGTLNFTGNAGETKTITVNGVGDNKVEPNENFVVNLNNLVNNGRNVTIGDSQGLGTLQNDDASISLAVSPTSVSEDGGESLVYTFTRSGYTGSSLEVNFTVGGTATYNQDYTVTGASSFNGNSGTINFAPGSNTVSLTVVPTADNTLEPDETVQLTLGTGSGYVVNTTTPVEGTILNDDQEQQPSLSLLEGVDKFALFTVQLTEPVPTRNRVTLTYTTVAGTAVDGEDYRGKTGTLSFAAGTDTAFIKIPIINNNVIEGEETFRVELSNLTGPGTLKPFNGNATISDTLKSSVSTSLLLREQRLIENLTLTGSADIDGTGGTRDNLINGNSGSNILAGDKGNDLINGHGGDDTLLGQAGNDTLIGGTGNDFFTYRSGRAYSRNDFGTDTLRDFSGGDLILLPKPTFTVLRSNPGQGFDTASDFATVTSDEAASLSSAFIVFNSSNNTLFYNQNGARTGFGTGSAFAVVEGVNNLQPSNFFIEGEIQITGAVAEPLPVLLIS